MEYKFSFHLISSKKRNNNHQGNSIEAFNRRGLVLTQIFMIKKFIKK